MNLPDTPLALEAMTPENRDDLFFAIEHDVTYIAASFVRSAADVVEIRKVLAERGARIPIIAKIENKEGVRNLEEIVASADGTMVARGDLGVEIPLPDVPIVQKQIIRTTVMNGKPVVTATQMLDSMQRNPVPTRAEVSDVANAILDGTSAVMLSGETAAGAYPGRSRAHDGGGGLAGGSGPRAVRLSAEHPARAVERDDRSRGAGGHHDGQSFEGGGDHHAHRERLHLALDLEVPPRLPDRRHHQLAGRRAQARDELGRDGAARSRASGSTSG